MPFKINHFPSKQKPDPVRDVYLPLEYEPPIAYTRTSRYKHIRTLRVKHDAHPNKFMSKPFEKSRAKQFHETIYNRHVSVSSSDTFHVVDNLTTNRLDIISQMYYGTPTLYWAIAQANPSIMFDPFNIPRGITLRIPVIDSLYRNGGALNAR